MCEEQEKTTEKNPYSDLFENVEMVGPFKIKFDLNLGIEVEGKLHKTVTMRKVKNKDILAIQNDSRLKDIAGQDFNMSGGNIVRMMSSMSPMIKMYALLFDRVVESIGDLTDAQITKKLFEDEMYNEDFQPMSELYEIFNGGGKNVEAKRALVKKLLTGTEKLNL